MFDSSSTRCSRRVGPVGVPEKAQAPQHCFYARQIFLALRVRSLSLAVSNAFGKRPQAGRSSDDRWRITTGDPSKMEHMSDMSVTQVHERATADDIHLTGRASLEAPSPR